MIKPNKYLDQILQGDALSVLSKLPDGCIDLGVTSPPYNKQEKHNGWLVKNVQYAGFVDKMPETEYQLQQIAVLDEIYRVMKPGGSFFYNHKTRWERGEIYHPIDWLSRTKWTIRQEIVWDRMIAANIRGWRFWQLDERIYWLYKPIGSHKIGCELKSKHALLGSIWRFPPERGNGHPAPFPLVLPARIIYSLLDDVKNGVVLDPYMGSGTTAVAAKLLGQRYIGIDISPEYVAKAKVRIANIESERNKLGKELVLHEVRETFAEKKSKGKFTGRHKKQQQAS